MSSNTYKMIIMCYYFIVISAVVYLFQYTLPVGEILIYAGVAIIIAGVFYHFGQDSIPSYVIVILINALSQGLIITATANLLDLIFSIIALINIAGIGVVLMICLLFISNPSNDKYGPEMIIGLNVIIIVGIVIGYLVTKDLSFIIYFMILVIVNFNSTIFLIMYDEPIDYMKYLAKRSFGIYIVIIPLLIIVALFSGDGDSDVGDVLADFSKKGDLDFDGNLVEDIAIWKKNKKKTK